MPNGPHPLLKNSSNSSRIRQIRWKTTHQQAHLSHLVRDKVWHRQGPKYKGSAHSVVNPLPTSQSRGSQPKSNQSSYSRPTSTQPSSPCSLCQGGHPLFYCPTFEGYSVSQRKEHVMSLKLCLNCLKPNHVAYDCRSTFRCKAQNCGKKHNSLLHEDRTATPTCSRLTIRRMQQPIQNTVTQMRRMKSASS